MNAGAIEIVERVDVVRDQGLRIFLEIGVYDLPQCLVVHLI